MTSNAGNMHLRPVTVIVPVYRNLEATRNCLESVLSSTLPEQAGIIVIDDNSPEEAVSAYCRTVSERSNIELVINRENLGFVGTANKGFTLDNDADIILLNSDTIVSNDWVQRLRACAYRQDNIGTVTPFTNNGTICSYPVFPISNSLPGQWSPGELDRAFQAGNSGLYCEIPTAIGFCMYIKRSCLDETGPFDEQSFGHGYGEECDFSLRASARGWKHALAADVFVFHEGAASFSDESNDRKKLADKILSELHPEYHELVSSFIERDPLYPYRRNVDAIRLDEKPDDARQILDEHYIYTKTILERSELARRSVLGEQEQRKRLESMLASARRQFAETDNALTDAQAMLTSARQRFAETDSALADAQAAVALLNDDIARQNNDINRLVDDIARLHSDLAESRALCEELNIKVRIMEQSRSWRYTAWMRKK